MPVCESRTPLTSDSMHLTAPLYAEKSLSEAVLFNLVKIFPDFYGAHEYAL
jgi:hypothetical protein